MEKTVKINKETYIRLSEVADELQVKLNRLVSMDETIQHLLLLRESIGGLEKVVIAYCSTS